MYFPRLLDLRQDADMTQKEVGALLGIDQRVYSSYETGKREIPVRHLILLADFTAPPLIISSDGVEIDT